MAVWVVKIAADKERITAAVAAIKSKLSGVRAAARDAMLSVAVEMLDNIVSYSGAKAITVELNRTFHKITLTITDDGLAFNPRSLKQDGRDGLGLLIACNMTDEYDYRYENGQNISVFAKYL